jgi:hypothetical protein
MPNCLALSGNGNARILIPEGFAVTPTTKACKRIDPSPADLVCTYQVTNGYVTEINFTNLCQSTAGCNQALTYKLSANIKNRENTKVIGGKFVVSVGDDNLDKALGEANNDLSIQPAPLKNASVTTTATSGSGVCEKINE